MVAGESAPTAAPGGRLFARGLRSLSFRPAQVGSREGNLEKSVQHYEAALGAIR